MAGFDVPVRYRSVERHMEAVHGSVRDLTLDELDILDTYAARVLDDIESAWPVDTSTSRDSFFYTLLDYPEIGFVISNDADYAEWIHYAGDDTPLVESLVPEVVDRYSDALIAALTSAIDRTEERVRVSEESGGRGLLDIISRRVGPRAPEVARAG